MQDLPDLKYCFRDFIDEIKLTEEQRQALIDAHKTLRENIRKDPDLNEIIIADFLQGSYRRGTIIRPVEGEASDVDVVVVTNLDKDHHTAGEALDKFKPFLEKNYPGRFEKKGHSWGINLPNAKIDLVPTSSPSAALKEQLSSRALLSTVPLDEAADEQFLQRHNYSSKEAESIVKLFNQSKEWQEEPLWIPNREADQWEATDPLSQISWTTDKNRKCNGYYLHVVKSIKWWWRSQYPDNKYPKGYPLEHFIGDSCPDGIESIAEGIVLAFEEMRKVPKKPFLGDRGIPENNVFARLSDEDYDAFYDAVCDAACLAREAYDAKDAHDATEKWNLLLGDKFPVLPSEDAKMRFTERAGAATTLSAGRFA